PGVKAGTPEFSTSVTLYTIHCLECHGSDGRGETARETTPEIPDFTNSTWHQSRGDQDLARAIWAGKKAMPAMRRKLAGTDVDKLVLLVRAFQGGRQNITHESLKGAQVSPRSEAG